jgi:hypothetical protein
MSYLWLTICTYGYCKLYERLAWVKWIHPSVLFRVDISQKPNPMMAFCTPSSLYIRIMYMKCHHQIWLLRGFVFGHYLMLSAVIILYTKFDSGFVYHAGHVAPISNKFKLHRGGSKWSLSSRHWQKFSNEGMKSKDRECRAAGQDGRVLDMKQYCLRSGWHCPCLLFALQRNHH